MEAEPMPSTCPLALNLIGPPIIIRDVMLVCLIASVSAFGVVDFARRYASAAIMIASNVTPTLNARNLSESFGNCFRNAASTVFVSGAFGSYQGTFEMQYSESL